MDTTSSRTILYIAFATLVVLFLIAVFVSPSSTTPAVPDTGTAPPTQSNPTTPPVTDDDGTLDQGQGDIR